MTIAPHPRRTFAVLLAAAAIAGCGDSDEGSDGGIPDNAREEFVSGCTEGGQSKAGCECLFEQLTTKQGVDTEKEMERLRDQVEKAAAAPDPASAVPPGFRKAAMACRSSLQ